jgi:predicted phage terminase large subunit-like protein
LAAYGQELDEAISRCYAKIGELVGVVVAAPPQHGKTFLTTHALIKALVTIRNRSHAYVTYAQQTAEDMQADARRVCEAIGLEIEGTKRHWWIPSTQSEVFWTSVDGPLTSRPVNGLLVIDDPFKGWGDARSTIEREARWQWVMQVATRRLHPGATIVIMATRWHPDDVSARALKTFGWRYVNIQAICTDPDNDPAGRQMGDALWPHKHSLEFLEKLKKADPFSFSSQYQGEPRELGDALFGPPQRFDELPDTRLGFYEAYGTDLAYSKSSTADWSVLILGRKISDTVYILKVVRKRMDATLFLDVIKDEQLQTDGSVRFYHGGGGELGVCSFFEREVRKLRAIHASADKVVRSTEVRKGWNLGKVLVPSEGSPFYGDWVKPFLQEVGVFTGIGDAHDDQVDALAALWDELEASGGDRSIRVSGPRNLQRDANGGLGGF